MNRSFCVAATQLSQPRGGYRFSADSVALAEFAQVRPFETVLDLCSGCGVIPILLWQHRPFQRAVGVEIDAELCALARTNVAKFQLEDKVHIIQADIRFLGWDDFKVASPLACPGGFDVITANPPYWPADRGRLNPNRQKAAARHEISVTLPEVLAAARCFLKPGGRFYLSHVEARKDEILKRLERENLAVRRMHCLSGRIRRLLLEACLREDALSA
jgi:tRNA1Val (adenine37-N6)-methyltransferase